MIPRTGPFPRDARIRRSREFREIAEIGQRYTSGAFVLLVRSAQEGRRGRLGITASRKVGGAVARNRVKRRVREWFRRTGQVQLPGLDVVVIARASAAGLAGSATCHELSRAAQSVR